MDNETYKVIEIFTKNKDVSFKFNGVNEIIGINKGFTIVNADELKISYKIKDNVNEACIFAYKNTELIAKDFVFFFEDEWNITIENYNVKGNPTHIYRLKLNMEGRLC